ncbi:DUF6916 family protein [Methylomagnum sp.]
MLNKITAGDFAGIDPGSLKLTIGNYQCCPKILKIKEHAAHAMRSDTPFTLTLATPPEWGFPQGTYSLEHPKLGELSLFMVPIGPCEEGMRFEIIFN